MLHLLDMKSIRMFFLMYLLLAQKGLEIRSVEVINFSVCYSPWLLDANYCGLDICRAGNGHLAGSADMFCSADVLS